MNIFKEILKFFEASSGLVFYLSGLLLSWEICYVIAIRFKIWEKEIKNH